MSMLVADVGGTNARLALSVNGVVDAGSIRHFRNREFDTFYDVVRAYLAGKDTSVERCCVALAGPTTPERGGLTNFHWTFEAARLNETAGAARSLLINDLTAMGYSLGGLPEGMARRICGTAGRAGNGQSLVVGMGTGFNVCPVKVMPGGALCCLEAEAGHTKLDADIRAMLGERIGGAAGCFITVEECLAGPGMARLYGAFTGGEALDGGAIVAACAEGDPQASGFMRLFSRLMGFVCQQLTLHHMPLGGIYLAGSVARGALSCGFIGDFEGGLRSGAKFREILADIPVHVIEDDTAPLIGCAVAAAGMAAA